MAVDTGSATASVMVNPVTVDISTTPAPATWPVEPSEDFIVTARVTNPSYSGMVTLDLDLAGTSSASAMLTISGNTSQTHAFGTLLADNYTLTASGTGIVPIASIRFTVATPRVTLTPQSASIFFGSEMLVDVAADAMPSEDVSIEAVASAGSTMVTRTVDLTSMNNYRGQVSFGSALPAGTYTIMATTTSSAVNMSIPSIVVDVMPVEVTLTTVPSTGATLLPTQSFSIMAQVTEPSSFSGMVALDLSLAGPSSPSTTLDLNGITPASYSFNPPWTPGDYMLDASGANIANIAPISFTVATPRVTLSPQSPSPYFGTDLVVDVSATGAPYTDATVTVIATRTSFGSSVREERAITLATTDYVDRPVTFSALPAGTYTIMATTTSSAVNMSIPSIVVDVMPVEVTLTTVPSTGATLLPTQSFSIMRR